jgi:putative transposase
VKSRDFNLNLENPMTEDRLPLAELLAKAGDGDFLRSVAEAVLQMLMEADVEGLIGAGRYERQGERATYRKFVTKPRFLEHLPKRKSARKHPS